MRRNGKQRSAARGGRRGRQARGADKYDLYQRAVQEPEPDLQLVQRVFRRRFGRPARLLREDFCGTGYLACTWAKLHRENRVFGVDLDPEPLAWGRRHNLGKLRPDQQARVKLIEGDVRDVGHEKVDVAVAFNFSFFIFRTRDDLRSYFEAARSALHHEGLLVLDAYGGADSQRTSQEIREVDGFDYIWDQHVFDPIHSYALNYIHFEFPDGSRMNRAFRYEWRLWSIPEIRELLLEAGFTDIQVYWEGLDRATGEANGVFTRRESAPDDPAWVAYITGAVA